MKIPARTQIHPCGVSAEPPQPFFAWLVRDRNGVSGIAHSSRRSCSMGLRNSQARRNILLFHRSVRARAPGRGEDERIRP
jgi:hypothetical protein